MAQVNFIINGHMYPITCKEGQEERLMFLQSIISKKEGDILRTFQGNISHEMLMMMLAIVLSDELSSKKETIHSQHFDTQEIGSTEEKINKIKKRIDLLSLKI